MAEELQGKDALVSCLGGSGSLFNRQPVTIYSDTAKIFANAMRRSGVNRLVVMSAWYISGISMSVIFKFSCTVDPRYLDFGYLE